MIIIKEQKEIDLRKDCYNVFVFTMKLVLFITY